jgi:PAS domain S-box-containing protein
MYNRWVNVQYAPKTDYMLVWQVLVVTFLIILIIFYRYVLLRKEVGKRKEAEEKLQKFTVTLSQKVYDATVDLEEKNLKLIESVYNFEDIFNTTMEMIIIFEEDGTIIDINRSGLKMLGYYYKSEVVGTKISKYILESELPKVYEDLRMDTHEPYELIVLRRDGSHLYTLNSSRRIVRDGKKVRLSTLMDLTEMRQKNSHLAQQSKMAAMGEMIENIAHQWRQPLSQVNSAVLLVDGLLDQKDIHDEQIESKLSEIEELTKYMSTTINDFKDFFEQEKKIVSFVLSDVVNKAVSIANFSLQNSQIQLTLNTDEEIILNGYPNELQQVVLVLINNAKDVLNSRKTVNPEINIAVKKSECNYRITVCDNAGGVEEEIIDKVFDPYFTTKHQSQGTGLGLYISKMIIQDSMHGTLEVQNREEGACFSVILVDRCTLK